MLKSGNLFLIYQTWWCLRRNNWEYINSTGHSAWISWKGLREQTEHHAGILIERKREQGYETKSEVWWEGKHRHKSFIPEKHEKLLAISISLLNDNKTQGTCGLITHSKVNKKLYSSRVETLYQTGLLLAIRVCLISTNQFQACLVQGLYLGRMKFLRVKRPYSCSLHKQVVGMVISIQHYHGNSIDSNHGNGTQLNKDFNVLNPYLPIGNYSYQFLKLS